MDSILKLDDNDTFDLVLEELLRKNHASRHSVSPEIANVIEAAKEDLRTSLIKANFNIDEVSDRILDGNYCQDRASKFVTLLKETKSELFRSIITHYNSSYGDVCMDFDWFVKLVLGTSESKVIRYPIIQLVLSTVNCNSQRKQNLCEMDKDVLTRLIKNLETSLKESPP
ncbi:uncharacterized protein LOC114363903 [Ostrinia furnacalis]|uniref:uncharacterized protein LOC114363903 n=1 Tax=Ostrinia furnacalis TaxID=93504 RepID=UPI001038D696|nr:uncharacterized protein LOC114363903 [Ostrinia furnacalis]